jgi:hypothetical protein
MISNAMLKFTFQCDPILANSAQRPLIERMHLDVMLFQKPAKWGPGEPKNHDQYHSQVFIKAMILATTAQVIKAAS